ncbi:MAG: DUF1002 domain-containing protein [Clostridia bacterium]|nr:DUF1002 domain-containing protein [Clostridia bacterium]
MKWLSMLLTFAFIAGSAAGAFAEEDPWTEEIDLNDIYFESGFYDETDENTIFEYEYEGEDEDGEVWEDPEEFCLEVNYPEESWVEPEEYPEETTEAAVETVPEESVLPAQYDTEMTCVAMGADLTRAQRNAVYADLGVEPGTVFELSVTNSEERACLSGILSDGQIGRSALSCVRITILPEGSGLDIRLKNVTYLTNGIIRNALHTAGIDDALVIVSAPYPVSGTGALTGIYKAYEYATDCTLSAAAKRLGAEELVITGELSRSIGDEPAEALIGGLKQILGETATMSDKQLKTYLRNATEEKLTDKQLKKTIKLIRRLEDLDENELFDVVYNYENDIEGPFSGVVGFLEDLFG